MNKNNRDLRVHTSSNTHMPCQSSTNRLCYQINATRTFLRNLCRISQLSLPFSQLTPINPSRQEQVPLTWLQEAPFMQVQALVQLAPNMPGTHATEYIENKNTERVELTTGMLN